MRHCGDILKTGAGKSSWRRLGHPGAANLCITSKMLRKNQRAHPRRSRTFCQSKCRVRPTHPLAFKHARPKKVAITHPERSILCVSTTISLAANFCCALKERGLKMATKFVLESMNIAVSKTKSFTFFFDGNGKITAGNGTFENPVPNSFSLRQIADCPFATSTCKRECYVHGLKKAEPEIYEAYEANSKALREILENHDYMKIVAEAFAYWIVRRCPDGFRWHVSGDIISQAHAKFIESVCVLARLVPFWIYTRSFDYALPLMWVPNLTVNLSADEININRAIAIANKFGLRICYMVVNMDDPSLKKLPDSSVIMPSYELRGRVFDDPKQAPWWQSLTARQKRMVCPPDFFGQSEKRRCGPCKKCLVKYCAARSFPVGA